MQEAVLFEIDDSVAIITINRPDQRNAINSDVRRGLHEAWDRFENDDSLRVAIITGSGDKAFCAGLDLKEASDLSIAIPSKDFIPIIGQNLTISKPTIAAVNGTATAGGWLFAQMCDLCVAADHAKFGIAEAKVGRGMPWATPLIHMIPQRILLELLLTGEPISAERAQEIGFVNRVVPRNQLMTAALGLARQITDNAPLTVRAARELVYMATEMGRTAALQAGKHLFDPVYMSEDAQEGPKAFKEKRKPQWKGR